MTGSRKAFGIALATFIAMSCLAASPAWASHPFHFASEAEHTILTGTQHAGNDDFIVDTGTIECNTVTYSGTVQEADKTTTTVRIAPSFSGCIVFLVFGRPIDVNNCEYVFHTGTLQTTNGGAGPHDYEGTVDISCPKGKVIEVTGDGCVVTVPPQAALGKVTFTNIGSGSTREVTIDYSIIGMTYEEHTDGLITTCANHTGLKQNGTLSGAARVTAENTAGEHLGFWAEKT